MTNIIGFIAQFAVFLALAGNPHVPNGPPSIIHHILVRDGYVVGWDPATKNPAWVCYTLCPENSICALERGSWFKRDPDLSGEINVDPDEYLYTGYDRGHCAAYKDQCDTERKARQSFYMSNMSPQLPCFNRQIWRYLEAEVRQMALTYGEVHVCTGPAWHNALLGMLNKRIWIPHSFWKVVTYEVPHDVAFPGCLVCHSCPEETILVAEEIGIINGDAAYSSGCCVGEPETRQIAFLLDNACYESGTNLDKFVVDVEVIEKLTGLKF